LPLVLLSARRRGREMNYAGKAQIQSL